MPLYTTEELLAWIAERNRTVHVSIRKNRLEDSEDWYYNEAGGYIENRNKSFFRVMGMQELVDGQVVSEQPIIIQNEIGYLGILCRRINGEMHCLMQAKIEPGNINHIQISPTIQATKSNFTQKHKGDKPPYLDCFLNASKYRIVVDQIQSEQSSRFYKKRNRNIILEVDEDVPVLPSHRWMTVGQLKELMRHDNLVNMDTRTVLSCLPLGEYIDELKDPALKRSAEGTGKNILPEIYQYINNYKMFDESSYRLVPLYSLKNWQMRDGEFVCDRPYSFKVVFCDIEIEGREVRHWTQPLF
ncbi:NDP-hexose 2,3-dehydratase family protein, partial [uncultured Dysosmobacter sp.]|uniref:NDP-hexose 2,3-dehydratase family protein n=1 Tax=uncultured Dysosmobacter sp. TaxID=2591384 RepID=UPI00261DF4E1